MTDANGGAGEPARPSDGEVDAGDVVPAGTDAEDAVAAGDQAGRVAPATRDDGAVTAPSAPPVLRSRTTEFLRLTVAASAGLAAGLLLWVLFGTGDAPAAPPRTFPVAAPVVELPAPTATSTPTTTATPSITGSPSTLPRSTPVHVSAPGSVPAPISISIPALGIGQRLIELGVAPDRTLEVPKNGTDIGWWKTGPAPGEPGGVVIAAHVTWGGGQPAIFYHLADLPIGSEVVLDREDGTAATYRVTQKQDFPKDHFPNDLIYRLDGPPQLYLVTCAGDFISGSYTDNVVVFGDLVSDTRDDSST